MDFSSVLVNKIDIIIEKWIVAVRSDEQMESVKELTYSAVRDGLPVVLQAIATMLSESQESDVHTLVQNSLEHGTLRAKQGYDAEEIAREYRLLRWAIFSSLEVDLLKGTAAEVNRAYRLIDTALDEVIARCFKSYTQERMREVEELQNQLRFTNQELTRLLRASQDNISLLAHELKTPLTSIIGYSDLFLRQQNQQNQQNNFSPNLGHIEKILRSGRQLLRMINDALEISRYEAGIIRLQPSTIHLCTLINSVVEMVEPLARAKELKIVVDCDRAPQQVSTDYLRLQQIVTNLIGNAIRYTEYGIITVKSQQLPSNEWSIIVTDTGIGIAPEDQTKIFQPYFQAANRPFSSLTDSTGLGLAIVTRLVNLLQGRIEVISELGVGSSFTVIFPLEVISN
ncbi:MAG TPA: HAMP domain-containing sensor histidine kinase [Kamptonema sp.]|nr:HAMP domain-containing sensor histidine kinase [Kamptonema sp.]